MQESASFLTTLAQISGTFIAIVTGFLVSQLVSVAERREASQFGIDKEYRRPLKRLKAIDQKVHEHHAIGDIVSVEYAFVALAVSTMTGLIVPLLFLALGKTLLSTDTRLILMALFLVSIVSALGFIAWYAWDVHENR